MAKSSSSRKAAASKSSEKIPAAYAKKDGASPAVDKDNSSKFQPTADADLDVQLLDSKEGLLKLFSDSLKDIYWAENHLVKSLPKMIKAASGKSLQDAISDHLAQTKNHVKRLESAFELIGLKPQAKKCDAMEGLTKEGEGVIETTDKGTPARDLGIIMGSQKVEHYEISAYRGLIKLAGNLGHTDVADLLSETLSEEEEADNILGGIADNDIEFGE